ncbi:hypothetical protein AAON49_10785 [Pseudotenacibaculum sp. MALMAid0570]|uniref:hypothetical protein n=1 Tax=Pseudotenacibaculum sp. MALMAid0570 TaxID=3143938 RepID=UPI0032DFEDC7
MNYRKFKFELNVFKLLLFTIATSFVSYGQETTDDQEIDSLLDELFFNDAQMVDDLLNSINQYDFIYSTITYNSNTFFAGRDSGIDQLNIIPQISYYSSSGFNASITSVYYERQNPNWDFVGVAVGYGNTIGKSKNLHYNLGYSRYFFSDGFDAFNNSLDVSLGIRNKNRTLGFMMGGSYLFGSEQSIQLSSRVYGNFTITRASNYAIKFRPQVNFLIAEQAITFLIPPRNGNPPRLVTTEEFGLLNTQINIPISYTTSTWDFELGWSLNMPSPIDNEGSLDSTNFFTITVGYLFDLTK